MALYIPNHFVAGNEARVGDVGFIDSGGAFLPAFNIFSKFRIVPDWYPPGFVTFEMNDHEIDVTQVWEPDHIETSDGLSTFSTGWGFRSPDEDNMSRGGS